MARTLTASATIEMVDASAKPSELKERRARGRPKASVQTVKRNAKSGEDNAMNSTGSFAQRMKKQRSQVADVVDDEDEDGEKKDKKLVFLSRSVLQKVRERPMVTGTQIANEILEMYKKFCDIGQKVDFKNVQRRVYDALNVLSAMDIIRKDKYNIIYNHYNEHIPSDFGLDWSDSDDNVDDPNKLGNGCEGAEGAGELGGANSGANPAEQRQQFTLSAEVVEQREKEVFDMRKRIRDKQKLFLELIK